MTHLRRTRFDPAAFLAVFLLLSASCGKEPRTPRARRVILVTCDTLRADHLSCYGYPLPTSPNVDAFAKDATVYENAWSCSSLTGPALSTLLSGGVPDQIGVSRGNPMLMDPSIETFPEVLAGDGIATAAVVSNWMLHRPPGEFAGWGVSQGFQHYDDEMVTKELNRDFPERTAGDTTDAAIAWLESVPGGKDGAKDSSFFLWVHYQDPHGPYVPPDDLVDIFLPAGKDGEAPLQIGTSNRGIDRIPAYQVIVEERRPSRYIARYDGEIRVFDEAFGRLIAWIRENGLLDDALVILTADHGESLGEHGRWFCHGENLHVEETRVPFIVRLPNVSGQASANVSGTSPGSASGSLRRGERTAELVSHLDIYPTVLAAFGFPPRRSLGESLFAPVSKARVVLQSLYEPDSPRRWAAMTTEEYRLIFDAESGFKLFHLLHDRGELQDISEKAPDRIREIWARGRTLMGPNPTSPTPGFERSDAEMKKALKSLGYVEGAEEH